MLLNQIRLCLKLTGSFIKALTQLIYGAWAVGKLPHPIITIFGSARHLHNPEYGRKAFDLAAQCSLKGISVLTGGGPGIMEAANCGAIYPPQYRGTTLGIGVSNLQEEPSNCVHRYIQLDYFFARKWLLMNYSDAFVVFPGGFGTFDELAELLTLIQTKRIKAVPIFLVDSLYWNPLVEWMNSTVLAQGAVNKDDLLLISVEDSIEKIVEALDHICNQAVIYKK